MLVLVRIASSIQSFSKLSWKKFSSPHHLPFPLIDSVEKFAGKLISTLGRAHPFQSRRETFPSPLRYTTKPRTRRVAQGFKFLSLTTSQPSTTSNQARSPRHTFNVACRKSFVSSFSDASTYQLSSTIQMAEEK